jgi:hypothetical protein
VAKAQELAGDRIVEVAAGHVCGQVLAAGLVDEVRMDVVLTPTNPRKPSTEGEALPVFLEDDLRRHWTRRGGASSPGD